VTGEVAETVLPVDGAAVDLRVGCVEAFTTAGYDTTGRLVGVPRWRVHCVRVLDGAPGELWSIVVPLEPPTLAVGDRVEARGLRARYWTARTRCGWSLSADEITARGPV
jgi:hypothetical protein